MKTLLEFVPVILFFIAYKIWGIYVATGVIIIATTVMVSVEYAITRKVEKMHLVALIFLVVLGGATILLRNELFIKWKVSVVNWLFALAFLGSQFIGEKPLAQRLLEKAVSVPAPVWTRLNLAWVGYFLTIGALNLWVALTFSLNTWVNFRMFGILGLTILFVVAQGLVLAPYLMQQQAEAQPEDED